MNNPIWLRRFSKTTCFSTLFLIFVGAMVKSTESGLSVPDWPLSYGMIFPPMVGGVFYEHGHRMVATVVGLFTLCLAIWLGVKEQRKWVKILGFCALGTVIAQGVLGGITVLFFLPTPISVLHGVLAQAFFILTIIIAYSLSAEREKRQYLGCKDCGHFLRMLIMFIVVIYIQLILGAVMRHTQSGLAIYDFPKIAGSWWPRFNSDTLFKINDWRFEQNLDPVTLSQVIYHFLHRVGALLVLVLGGVVSITGLKQYRNVKKITKLIYCIDFIILIQIGMGVAAVLSLKSPIITSIHVVTGAGILGLAVLLLLRAAPLSMNDFVEQIKG